ncbi:hypothetical protein [Desulfosudis oleivorans]|uniref:Uncharacterized protein n=1 Tax=Desulfosudis oleivorans (strain DSM 6200 / JCM 39069 / Hxd3) TaxID=96561 RepID=A9A0I8_DESOH|nr:hypothetical protein [Desulfosudis oleivorans]ABW67488.1 hypothetical protein Dole_1684 [Desulfosudis oleivorans Hxd3]
MKTIPGLLFAAVLLCLSCPHAHAQEFGKIRALQQRADTVVRQKNSFVARVLDSYQIPHQINEQGVVVRIQVEEKWHDVTAIEIVPLLRENAVDVTAPREVTAHEIYFFTAEGVLDLVSELRIR